MKALEEVEPTWGGDIRTRMAAQEAAYRAATNAPAPAQAVATETNAPAPTAAPAVRQATDASSASQEATVGDIANGVGPASIGTTEPSDQQ